MSAQPGRRRRPGHTSTQRAESGALRKKQHRRSSLGGLLEEEGALQADKGEKGILGTLSRHT